jgi:putative DNA primase/helicase
VDATEFLTKQPEQKALPPVPAREVLMLPSGKVQIDISYDHLPTLNGLCWQAISQCNEPPLLFRFAGQWSRVASDDLGRPCVQPASKDVVRHHLSQWAEWFKDIPQVGSRKPPMGVICDVMATHNPKLPILRRIVTTPVFARDGSLSLEPGYNAASGVYYAPKKGFVAEPVPDFVSQEQVEEAREFVVTNLLIDFPFATPADRANALGLFLLPFARDLIEGATPNHLVEASIRGSGKTLLVNALMFPALGCEVATLTEQHTDEDWRKAITSHLLAAFPVALIDNVNRTVNSGALAAAWTATTWNDRILGKSELANVPIETIWTMTGNNVTMSSELVRRSVRVRLVPNTDKPEERQGFKHENLKVWCRENQARLVWCAHVIIKWWLQHGSPSPEGLKPMGSFEEYARVIGGCLYAVGFKEFLANSKEFQAASDTDTDVRAAFCANWWNWTQQPDTNGKSREWSSATELLPIAAATEGFPLPGKSDANDRKVLGQWLTRYNQTFVSVADEITVNEGGQESTVIDCYRLRITSEMDLRSKSKRYKIARQI